MPCQVFVSGGTGYIGTLLGAELVKRGREVRAIVRAGSFGKLPPGVMPVAADALVADSFARYVSSDDTFVHLTGVSHPAPWKAEQFRNVDQLSFEASLAAARQAGIPHFVYVSVAHPAPVMKAYIEVRIECERLLRESGLNATVLRPWYVLGPGHRWAAALKPAYALAEALPATRETARRLGLVTREQMIAALVGAIENPARGVRILGVPEIRAPGETLAG